MPRKLVLDVVIDSPSGKVELEPVTLTREMPFDLYTVAHRGIKIPVRVKVFGIPVKMRISADVTLTLKTVEYQLVAHPEESGSSD